MVLPFGFGNSESPDFPGSNDSELPDEDTENGIVSEVSGAGDEDDGEDDDGEDYSGGYPKNIERIVQRERERTARRVVQSIEGNADALAWLNANRLSRYGERGQRNLDELATEKASVMAKGRAFVEKLDKMRVQNPVEFAETLSDTTVAGRYVEWRKHLIDIGTYEEAQAAPANPVVSEMFTELRADPDAELLTEDDWDDLDPDNFSDLSPSKAAAKMAKEFRVRIAKAQAKAATRQAAANKTGRLNQTAQAIQGAIAKAPPAIGKGNASRQSFESVRDAYIENPTDANRIAYEQARQSRGW